jgi:hypothetical protein
LRHAEQRRDERALYFDPEKALARVAKEGDLFAPLLKKKQKLPGSLKKSAA